MYGTLRKQFCMRYVQPRDAIADDRRLAVMQQFQRHRPGAGQAAIGRANQFGRATDVDRHVEPGGRDHLARQLGLMRLEGGDGEAYVRHAGDARPLRR